GEGWAQGWIAVLAGNDGLSGRGEGDGTDLGGCISALPADVVEAVLDLDGDVGGTGGADLGGVAADGELVGGAEEGDEARVGVHVRRSVDVPVEGEPI